MYNIQYFNYTNNEDSNLQSELEVILLFLSLYANKYQNSNGHQVHSGYTIIQKCLLRYQSNHTSSTMSRTHIVGDAQVYDSVMTDVVEQIAEIMQRKPFQTSAGQGTRNRQLR